MSKFRIEIEQQLDFSGNWGNILSPKICWSEKKFGSKMILGSKNFWVQKYFLSKKFWVSKIFAPKKLLCKKLLF